MASRVEQQFGNYRLIRLLGRGGFAEVYLGEHVFLKRQAAIKVLRSQGTEDALDSFLNEAQTIARLEHPNIVRIFDFGVEDKIPFLVMTYAPNGTLHQRHCKGSRLPLPTIVAYMKQIAAALQYAHVQKVIHRDVKPQNMLIGLNDEILLSDFGLAIVSQSTSSQSTQNQAGTLAYMAPEQFQGKPRPASDQYALGIVVYEWLCGERPFSGIRQELEGQHQFAPPPLLRQKVPGIPPALEQVVLKALEKDPHDRFASVQDFANALEQADKIAKRFKTTASSNQSYSPDLIQTPGPSSLPSLSHIQISDPLFPSQPLPADVIAEQNQPVALVPQATAPNQLPSSSRVSSWNELLMPSKSPRRHSVAGRIGVSLLIIMLLLGGGLLYSVTNWNHPASTNSFSSTSILRTLTPVFRTTTPTLSTSTPAVGTPQSSSTPIIPAGWHQVLNDPLSFSHHEHSWVVDGLTCKFPQNASYYEVISTGLNYCNYADWLTKTGNLVYVIDLSIRQVNQGKQGIQAGLIFREADDNYYYFSITITGDYLFTLHEHGSGGQDIPITPESGVFSPAIHQGLDQWNTLEVIAQGSSFKLYINGHYIITEKNSTLCTAFPTACSSQSEIGVEDNGSDPQNLVGDAWFKNAAVWIP